jgi:hypothetical protein
LRVVQRAADAHLTFDLTLLTLDHEPDLPRMRAMAQPCRSARAWLAVAQPRSPAGTGAGAGVV